MTGLIGFPAFLTKGAQKFEYWLDEPPDDWTIDEVCDFGPSDYYLVPLANSLDGQFPEKGELISFIQPVGPGPVLRFHPARVIGFAEMEIVFDESDPKAKAAMHRFRKHWTITSNYSDMMQIYLKVKAMIINPRDTLMLMLGEKYDFENWKYIAMRSGRTYPVDLMLDPLQ